MPSDPDRPDSAETSPYDERHIANLAAALRSDQYPSQIGPYTIEGIVGEGGMGTVYKAQQTTPIHRTVAIKVIKFGLDSKAVLARFESEREALAVLDHPNVARVLDAGTTDTGRPYFVMEFVDGEPITAFADQHRLSVRERLRLMTQACDAIQHAHQKAIIHRDIKPSNILVVMRDGAPLVKVIDFGVAKAIERTETAQTLFTEIGQLIGTPEYMSPEQAEGSNDIDTRTDVYSLGVVLYELLSGLLPFDSRTLRKAGYGEVCRIIREIDPPRPSAKLSSLGAESTTVAERRQLSPATLAQQLRAELDWIVVKSLRKDRESRYASPRDLAQDIDNYLGNRPLRAGPESVVYRTRKFVRRNKAGVIGAAGAILLLIGGIAATSWQAIRATRAEMAIRDEQQKTLEEKKKAEDAQKAAEEANQATASINEFLTGMFGSVNPEQARGQEVLVKDVLDRASAQIGTTFADRPRIEASLRRTLGNTYMSLGMLKQADEHLVRVHEINKALFGEDQLESIQSYQQIAALRIMQDRLTEAYDMTQANLERCKRVLGEDDRQTINTTVELGVISEQLGKLKQAEELLRAALAADERIGKADTEDYYITLGNLGQMMRQHNRLAEAEDLTFRAYQGMSKLKGEDHPIALGMLGTYADTLRLQGRLPEAETQMRAYMDRAMKVYGPNHMQSILPEQGLAIVLQLQGRQAESEAHFRSALSRMRKTMGDQHRETLFQVMTFAASRYNNGDYAESAQLFNEAYKGWVATVGPEHPSAVIALYGVVQCGYPTKQWAAALEPAKALYQILQDPTRVEITPARRARYLSGYGICLAHLGRHEEAIGPLMVAYEALVKEDIKSTGNYEAYWSVTSLLAGIAEENGRQEEAQHWRTESDRFGPSTIPTRGAPTTLPARVPTTNPA